MLMLITVTVRRSTGTACAYGSCRVIMDHPLLIHSASVDSDTGVMGSLPMMISMLMLQPRVISICVTYQGCLYESHIHIKMVVMTGVATGSSCQGMEWYIRNCGQECINCCHMVTGKSMDELR